MAAMPRPAATRPSSTCGAARRQLGRQPRAAVHPGAGSTSRPTSPARRGDLAAAGALVADGAGGEHRLVGAVLVAADLARRPDQRRRRRTRPGPARRRRTTSRRRRAGRVADRRHRDAVPGRGRLPRPGRRPSAAAAAGRRPRTRGGRPCGAWEAAGRRLAAHLRAVPAGRGALRRRATGRRRPICCARPPRRAHGSARGRCSTTCLALARRARIDLDAGRRTGRRRPSRPVPVRADRARARGAGARRRRPVQRPDRRPRCSSARRPRACTSRTSWPSSA